MLHAVTHHTPWIQLLQPSAAVSSSHVFLNPSFISTAIPRPSGSNRGGAKNGENTCQLPSEGPSLITAKPSSPNLPGSTFLACRTCSHQTADSGDGYRETKTMNEHITNFPVQKGILLTLRVSHEKMVLQHSPAFCSIALPAPYSLSLALKIPLRCCETSQASHLEFSQNFNWIYVSWIW